MHPLQFNHCSQSQVAAPTCARQLTDGSAQSNCSSRRSATLPITFFLISKIWKGDLRARFCVQLWILMNELCGFSHNRHPTSPEDLKQELAVYKVNPHGTCVGHQKPHFSRLPVPVARITQTCGSLSCQTLLRIVWAQDVNADIIRTLILSV